MKKAAFHNLGCKVNEYETEAMKQALSEQGYEIVPFEETADVYVVNTCTVTQIADKKSRQMLHQARKRNPGAVVVAVGCYAQKEGSGLPEDEAVDLILGNHDKLSLAPILEAYFGEKGTGKDHLTDIGSVREYDATSLDHPVDRTRGFVKIQDGCNQFCSYCLIPYVRGRVRSRRMEDILKELSTMGQSGVKEVTLSGIHMSSYGLDFANPGKNMRTPEAGENFLNKDLLDLLLKADQVPGIQRIRLGSLEPGIMTEDFVKGIAAMNKLCPHFHLSLQSGSDTVLKRMNRRYTTEEFRRAVFLLRKYFDRPAITTDVIAGFPGETEEEAKETEAFVREIGFAKMHIFKYSRREGTVAAGMRDQVTDQVKTRRSAALQTIDKQNHRTYAESLKDREIEVLFEEKEERDGRTFWKGHSRENLLCLLASEEDLENTTVGTRLLSLLEDGAVLVEREI